MMTATEHAFRVVVWQTLVAFALMAVALLLETFAGVELPRSLAALGVAIGAQTYATSLEMKTPGALDAVLPAVALRAALCSTLVQVLLAGLMLAHEAGTATPELTELTTFLTTKWWPIPACVVVAFVTTYCLTRFALGIGVRSTKRARMRQSAAAPGR